MDNETIILILETLIHLNCVTDELQKPHFLRYISNFKECNRKLQEKIKDLKQKNNIEDMVRK